MPLEIMLDKLMSDDVTGQSGATRVSSGQSRIRDCPLLTGDGCLGVGGLLERGVVLVYPDVRRGVHPPLLVDHGAEVLIALHPRVQAESVLPVRSVSALRRQYVAPLHRHRRVLHLPIGSAEGTRGRGQSDRRTWERSGMQRCLKIP